MFGKVYYKLQQGIITNCDSSLYYKLRQVRYYKLQIGTSITNCNRHYKLRQVFANCDRYYKLRQPLLQIATGITNCDVITNCDSTRNKGTLNLLEMLTKKMDQHKYFNCTLQTESGTTTAICFSLLKRTLVKNFETQKSPVKISKYTFRTDDVVIQPCTVITPIQQTFEHGDTWIHICTTKHCQLLN